MTHELTDYISNCETCNTYQAVHTKEPLINHPIPSHPWEKIGVDFFTLDSKDYLCTVDYYSDYFEIDSLPHKKDAKTTVKRLKRHFSTHGIPAFIYSDNGPPFNSHEFANFANDYEFQRVTSSPECPQSNGKVESAVKIAKTLLRKNTDSNGDVYQALLAWRNTPTEGMGSSPAQRFFGRRTRTGLPISPKLLKPKVQSDVKAKKQDKQACQKRHYDKNAKELPKLKTGDTIRIKQSANRTNKRWEKGQVQDQVNIRSYKVRTEDGREYRRNRRHLKLSSESFIPQHEIQFPTNAQDESTKDTTKQTQNANGGTPRNTENTEKTTPPETELINIRQSTRERRAPAYLKDYIT